MKNKIRFEFMLSGFVIALLLISMLSVSFALFQGAMVVDYNLTSTEDFGKYNKTAALFDDIEEMRDATNIQQEQRFLDMINAYFMQGYNALKISLSSIDLFSSMMTSAEGDLEYASYHLGIIYAIILIALILGVVITVLLKMRI